MKEGDSGKMRSYDNSTRREAAAVTRRRILDAATRILLSGGYAGMTVARLATAADVSPQTVYNAIGGKAQVVKAVYDTLLAGDEDPIPMSERPGFLAMRDSADPKAFFEAYAAWSRGIYARVGPLLGVLLEGGSGGDAALREFVATIEAERRTGNGHALELLRRSHGIPRSPGRAALHDAVWTLTSPEVADRLIRRCGWSARRYESWLARQLLRSYEG